ncbi:hypothetical protein [Deinococcus sp. UYEF24]
MENRILDFFFSPRVQLLSRDVPQRLRKLEVPPGVRVAGTYSVRRRAFRKSAAEDITVVIYTHPDLRGVWSLPQISRALVLAGFESDSSSHPGFDPHPRAFCWNAEKTQILLVEVRPGELRLHLLTNDGQPDFPGRIPGLHAPLEAEVTEVGLDAYALRLPTAVGAEVVLADLAGQITAQGWEESNRLTTDWGAFASFTQSQEQQPQHLLTLALTRTGAGQWLVHLNSHRVPTPEELGRSG